MANDEWGTPSKYIESARLVMGSIDLDPATNKVAQETVKSYHVIEGVDNAIADTASWHGNVWLNPPYSKPLVSKFAKKVCEKYINGEIKQAVVLTNNTTDTKWFVETLGRTAKAYCFASPRIQFIAPPDTKRSSNSRGQVF